MPQAYGQYGLAFSSILKKFYGNLYKDSFMLRCNEERR
jgi:hypothetical protein